jgi:hypothetical protein
MRNKASTLVLTAVLIVGAGCGPSTAERDTQNRSRLELEEKQRREAEAANKAITEMNKKLGRKPPAIDLGLPRTSKSEPAPEKPKQP